MAIVGKDCRDIGEVLHNGLDGDERRSIAAARARAGEIADIWLDHHFHGVKWYQDAFGYLMRVAGKNWWTAHYNGSAERIQTAGGQTFPAFSKARFRSDLVAMLLHARRTSAKTEDDQTKWAYRGNDVIGLGFPIHDNNRQRRVLSIDVDYQVIKDTKKGWPAVVPKPDWRDPLAKPNLLLMGETLGADVEGRARDAELLRELGALVMPGETGFQAHFYLVGRHKRAELRPLVEALGGLLHGKIDVTNVGTYKGNGKWQNGLPSSLPLPTDRRHLAAFVIDPIIDSFYQGDFCVSLGVLAQQVEAKLASVGRLSPPPTTRGASSQAELGAPPSAALPAAPTVGDHAGCSPAPLADQSGVGDYSIGKNSSGYNGIHTPDQAEADEYVEAASLSIRKSMSKAFLARLDAILAGTGPGRRAAHRRPTAHGSFPYSLLDPQGLIWSHIASIDPLLDVPPDVPLGVIREGETNTWIQKGLAHFHSREEFGQAIAGQGDEQVKVARYEWAAGRGVQAVHQAAVLPAIDDAFFEGVWQAVLTADPANEDDNKTNVARAIENRRRRFVVACHGLVSSRRSYDGFVVLPVKGSVGLLVSDSVNLVAFGRDVVAPVKLALFDVVCMAWIKGWRKQQNPTAVLVPNQVGQALVALLPQPRGTTYLEFDPVAKKSEAYFYDHSYREALAAKQSAKAMSAWLRPKQAKGKPHSAS